MPIELNPRFDALPRIVQAQMRDFWEKEKQLPKRLEVIINSDLFGTVEQWPPENFDVVIAIVDWVQRYPGFAKKYNNYKSSQTLNAAEPAHKDPQES